MYRSMYRSKMISRVFNGGAIAFYGLMSILALSREMYSISLFIISTLGIFLFNFFTIEAVHERLAKTGRVNGHL